MPQKILDCRAAYGVCKVKKSSFRRFFPVLCAKRNKLLVALGLPIPSQGHSPVPPPTGFAEADVSYPGVGVLELRCRPVEGQPPLDWRSDYGYRIYYGVLPPGGASVEQATGKQRLLMQPPDSADLLPHSQWCRRKKEQFDFHGNSGWTAWFCIRYENSKGDFGYWGPLFSAVIP